MEAHELLQAIQAMGEQPKIVVSVEVKRSIGQWESITGNAYLTFHLPAGTSNDEVLAEYQRVYAQAYAIAEANAEASVQRHKAMQAELAAQAAQEAATVREARERNIPQPDPGRLEAVRSTLPSTISSGRHLERAPKADQRQPGDYWEETPNEYTLVREPSTDRNGNPVVNFRLSLFKAGLSFKVGELFSWQEAWPDDGWLRLRLGEEWETLADGQKHEFTDTVRIINRVSDRTAERTGNYRVDVINIQ